MLVIIDEILLLFILLYQFDDRINMIILHIICMLSKG